MKANDSDILRFIGENSYKMFIVPPFQRNYEWTVEQCEELFDDIVSAHQKNKPHYLGNIVYYEGNESGASFHEYIIVDGQQRITTVILLLCALRDFVDDAELKNNIERQYILNDSADKRFRLKLRQTSYDSENFVAVVERNQQGDKTSNIVKNYEYFKTLLKDAPLSPRDIYDTIRKLEIVDVNLKMTDDLEAIQTIFEKINSTGKRLEQADLIRNYLLISKSSGEQERLYNNYWLKIEEAVGGENVSRFAHDYLILKIFSDVQKDEVFKTFKNHFNDLNSPHEEILQDMLKYAKYFAHLTSENSGDEKLDRIIKELNFLKTADAYPLYLYMMRELWEKKSALGNIFSLLSDFFLRYRIVTPSAGGGALRNVVYQILKKLCEDEIELTYDDIYFELSNSATKAGRFPSDEDFAAALMESRETNHRYGKLILLKIEESETKNIPAPLEKITVEHFMPQTLTEWWRNNLGGKENAERVYDACLHCIGNLGIMSQGYNSANSNKPWTEKREQIKSVQFNVTADAAECAEWKEPQIKARNEKLAKAACVVIRAPLPRERGFAAVEFIDGLYPAADVSTSMDSAKIGYMLFGGKKYEVAAWRAYFNKLCEILFGMDKEKFVKCVDENQIHKKTAKRNAPDFDPIITRDKSKVDKPMAVVGTNFFSEGTLSSKYARIYATRLLEIFDVAGKVQIFVYGSDETDG